MITDESICYVPKMYLFSYGPSKVSARTNIKQREYNIYYVISQIKSLSIGGFGKGHFGIWCIAVIRRI